MSTFFEGWMRRGPEKRWELVCRDNDHEMCWRLLHAAAPHYQKRQPLFSLVVLPAGEIPIGLKRGRKR